MRGVLTSFRYGSGVRCPQNLILRALPRDDLERLFPYLELVQLKPKRLLHPGSVRVEHLYFIEEGLLSVVAKADQRKSVAVWLIGPEGVSGLPLILGQEITTYSRLVVVGGWALRIRADDLRRALRDIESLRTLLFRHILAVVMQTAQSIATA